MSALRVVFMTILGLTLTMATGTPAASPAVGSTRLSGHAWSLDVPAPWRVAESSEGWAITNGTSTIEVRETTAYSGSQMDCVVGEMSRVKTDVSTTSTAVWRDDPSVPASEMEQGHSSMTYTVERTSGDDDVVRIDCYTVERGSIDLAMTHRSPRTAYAVERVAVGDFRAHLQWPRP